MAFCPSCKTNWKEDMTPCPVNDTDETNGEPKTKQIWRHGFKVLEPTK